MDWWLLSALAGIWLGTQLDPTVPLWGWMLLTAGLFAVAGAYSWISPYLPRMLGRLVSRTAVLMVCALLCGMLWALINAKTALYANLITAEPKTQFIEPDTLITVQVKISSIVDQNDMRWRFDVRSVQDSTRLRLNWYNPQGQIPRSGEIWEFTVRVRPLSGRLNQGGFNYQAYLVRHGISALGQIRDGHRVSEAPPGLFAVRQAVFDQFSTSRSQLANADILLALALGERQWITQQRWQTLQYTGLAHLMAISGLHLTIVFATCFVALRWLLARLLVWYPRGLLVLTLALGGAWVCALGYAALAGFAVATLRALVLVSLFLLLRVLVIRLTPLRVWLRTVALVLVLDPLAWLDAGFWLSALAVGAIFVWNWRTSGATIHTWYGKLRALWRFELMLVVTLFPLSVAFFHGTSWIAPLTNLLGIPLFTFWVLPLTLSGVVVGWVIPPVGLALWQLADKGLSLIWLPLMLIEEASWVHWADSRLGWLVVIAAVIYKWPVDWRLRLPAFVAVSLSVLWITAFEPVFYQRDPRLYLHMLDVGQGSALVIQRGRRALIIDAGPAYPGGFELGSAAVIPFLRYHRLQPDMLILSHPHRDHTGGADALRRAYPALNVAEIHTSAPFCAAGQAWAWQGVSIHHLAPLPGPSYGPNNDSCVVRLRYQGEQILLAGDIERLAEFRLVSRYGQSLASSVLLIPHHGSRTSSHPLLLDAVQPQYGLLSTGYLNRFGLPHAETMQRLEEYGVEVFNTAQLGQVSLLWHKNRWQVYSYRQNYAAFWFNQLP